MQWKWSLKHFTLIPSYILTPSQTQTFISGETGLWDIVCCYCQGYKILLWLRMKVWLFVEIEVEPALHPFFQGGCPSVEVWHLSGQQLPTVCMFITYTVLRAKHCALITPTWEGASFLQHMLHMVKMTTAYYYYSWTDWLSVLKVVIDRTYMYVEKGQFPSAYIAHGEIWLSDDNCMLLLVLERLVVQVLIKHTWRSRIRACWSVTIRLLVELSNCKGDVNVSSMSGSTLMYHNSLIQWLQNATFVLPA